jgi:DNA mismatch endonuclease, patch repair protein
MADVVDKATRSRMMAGIKGKNTKPEILVRKALHAEGFRFRLHVKDLPGKPDIVLPKYRAVIFVHGCFWHGHECKYFRWPTSRKNFWQSKIMGNRARDMRSTNFLRRNGWKVNTIWECQLRKTNVSSNTMPLRLSSIISKLKLAKILMDGSK